MEGQKRGKHKGGKRGREEMREEMKWRKKEGEKMEEYLGRQAEGGASMFNTTGLNTTEL